MSHNNIFENNESTIKDSVSEIGRHEKNNSENKIIDLTQNLKKKFALKFNTMRAVTKNSALDIDIRDKSKLLMSRMNWLIVLKDIYESLRNRFINVTPQLVTGAINMNRNDFILMSEEDYYQTYSELGFNIEEILTSISLITSIYITYDDLFNIIGGLGKETAKSCINHSINMKKSNVRSSSSISFMTDNSELFEKSSLQKSESKINDVSMKETELNKQLTNNVRSSCEHIIETARFNKIDPNPSINEEENKTLTPKLQPEIPSKTDSPGCLEHIFPKIFEKQTRLVPLSSSEMEVGKLGSMKKSPNFSANSDDTINISSALSTRPNRASDSSNSKIMESSDKNNRNIRIFNENKESSEKKKKTVNENSSSPLSFNISAIKPNESLSPKTFTLSEFGNELFGKNEKNYPKSNCGGITSNEKKEKQRENTETANLKKILFHLPIERIQYQKNNVDRIVEGMRKGSKKELVHVLKVGGDSIVLIEEEAVRSFTEDRNVNGMAKELFNLINVLIENADLFFIFRE